MMFFVFYYIYNKLFLKTQMKEKYYEIYIGSITVFISEYFF